MFLFFTAYTISICAKFSKVTSYFGLEWVAYLFSHGSSWLRNWTRVSCIADAFFANWALREAWKILQYCLNYPFHLRGYVFVCNMVWFFLPSNIFTSEKFSVLTFFFCTKCIYLGKICWNIKSTWLYIQ